MREKNRRKIEYKAFEKREETKQKGKKNQNRKIKEIRKCKNSQKRKKRFLKVVWKLAVERERERVWKEK